MFLCVWVYLRHYVNLRIILSLFTEYKTVGPYALNWETEQYKCLLANVITLALLAMLQALNLFWLFWIVRSAYRLVVHKIAKDERSDGEEPAPEEIEQELVTTSTNKVGAVPLLGHNGSANGSATGAIKATSNGTARPPTKRKSAL
jgi:acyl-CoA-dependent ceramide synthase